MSLYHEAAEVLTASSSEGGSLKSRVFKKKGLKSPPNQVYALALETAKWSPVLKEVIEKAGVLKTERKLTPPLSLLLVHDFLVSKGGIALPLTHGLRAAVERHKGRLASELTLARLRRKAPSLDALRVQINKQSAGEEASYPRWVRINAVKSSLEDQLGTTFAAFARAASVQDIVSKSEKHLYIDPHVPNLMAVTPGTDLTKTEAYLTGKIILQDKASCFPAYLLDPRSEDGDVVDACAAPGNKTTHLAAILKEHRPEFEAPGQVIFAFEKDSRRAQTLEKMVTVAGTKKVTRIGFGQDFLQVDPNSEKYKAVGALLLDPSCSGSGIVGRDSMPELHLPEAVGSTGKPAKGKAQARKRKHDEVAALPENILVDDDGVETVVNSEKDLEMRLEALSGFQLTLLLHAFKFPSAKKITYSTCSIHMQENERVVQRALQSEAAKQGNWRILPRRDQVSGMKEWPVRGSTEACGGDAEVADACIRSYKDDGRGVMGFFVAGFIRVGAQDTGLIEDDEGPYLRDEDGRIIRDMLGMPVLKVSGAPVSLKARNEVEVEVMEEGIEEEEEDDNDSDDSDDIDSDTSDASPSRHGRNVGASAANASASSNGDVDEWQGFGD
ncbi:hypothetical protein G7046_g5294 [Stylonectria norvegica]|nr:hypothetical protein G7046_g5294 [Stylonectria norvegica]